MKAYQIALAALVLGATVPGPGAVAQTTYRVIDAGSLGGAFNPGLREINASGQATGFAYGSDGKRYAFVWTPAFGGGEVIGGTLKALPALSADNRGVGINDLGDVAGSSYTSYPDPVLWQVGKKPIKLGKLAGFSSGFSTGVNNARQVIGRSGHANWSFLWQNGKMVGIDTISGPAGSQPNDINEAGRIVGEFIGGRGNGYTWGYLWTPDVPNGNKGSMIPLYDLWPRSINENNAIVGLGFYPMLDENGDQIINSDGYPMWWSRATVLDGSSRIDLGTLPDYKGSTPHGTNNQQPLPDVVGSTMWPYISGTPNRAMLWRDGTGYDLNTLLDPVTGAGWNLTEANSINDSGWITANGSRNGVKAGCILVPILAP